VQSNAPRLPSDSAPLARQTNQATAIIDGIKAKKIPAKKSGVIDCSIATMAQFETLQC
jgi:hypothetical protein